MKTSEMNYSEIKSILIDIIQDYLEVDKEAIKDEFSKDDVEDWDSLNQMNIITAIEEKFNIHFENDELPKLDNLPEIISLVDQKIKQKTR